MSTTPSGTIANASVGITAITKEFERQYAKIEDLLKRFSDRRPTVTLSVSTAVASAGINRLIDLAARAASAIPDAISGAVTGASNLNETMTKTGQVFGANTKAITGAADKAATRFGVLRQEFLDASSNIGLIGKASGLAGKDLTDLSVRLTNLAIDVSSFFNTSTNEALMSFRSGLVGEAEPMRRFGVLLSEAAVKNEALALGLAKTKGQLSEGAKVQARASIMFRQLSDASGDLARTSNSLSNRWRLNASRMQNALTDLGTGIMPIFQGFANIAEASIRRFEKLVADNRAIVGDWADWVGKYIDRASLVWTNFGDVVGLALNSAGVAMQSGFKAILKFAGYAWEQLKVGASWATEGIQSAFAALASKIQEILIEIENWTADFLETLSVGVSTALTNALADFGRKNAQLMALIPGMMGPAAALDALASVPKEAIPRLTGGARRQARLTGEAAGTVAGLAGAPGPDRAATTDEPNWMTKLAQKLDFKKEADRFALNLDNVLGVHAVKRMAETLKEAFEKPLTNMQRLVADNNRRNLGRSAKLPFGALGAGVNTLTRKPGESDADYRKRFEDKRAGDILKRRKADDAAGRRVGRDLPDAVVGRGPGRFVRDPAEDKAFMARMAGRQAQVRAARQADAKAARDRDALVGPPKPPASAIIVPDLAAGIGALAKQMARKVGAGQAKAQAAGLGVAAIAGGAMGGAAGGAGAIAGMPQGPAAGRKREPRRGFGPRWGFTDDGGEPGAWRPGSGPSRSLGFEEMRSTLQGNIQAGGNDDPQVKVLEEVSKRLGVDGDLVKRLDTINATLGKGVVGVAAK